MQSACGYSHRACGLDSIPRISSVADQSSSYRSRSGKPPARAIHGMLPDEAMAGRASIPLPLGHPAAPSHRADEDDENAITGRSVPTSRVAHPRAPENGEWRMASPIRPDMPAAGSMEHDGRSPSLHQPFAAPCRSIAGAINVPSTDSPYNAVRNRTAVRSPSNCCFRLSTAIRPSGSRIAHPNQTVPTGLPGEPPPGPAIPVTATP